MDKRVLLRDYMDRKIQAVITDFEKVELIGVLIITSDEILVVRYKDGHTEWLDSSDNRRANYFDGLYELPLDMVDAFSEFEGSSYDCESYISELKERTAR